MPPPRVSPSQCQAALGQTRRWWHWVPLGTPDTAARCGACPALCGTRWKGLLGRGGGKCGAHMWLWEGMPGGTPSHEHPGHRHRPCPWLGSWVSAGHPCRVRPQLPPEGTQQLVPAPQAVATTMQRGGDPRAVPRMGRRSFTRSHLPGRDVPSRNPPPSLLADLLMRSRFSGGSQALIPIKASRLEPALAQPAGYGSRRGAPGGPPAETGSREALANTRSCWKPALRAAALSMGLTSGAAAERGTSGRSRHEVGAHPKKRFS